VSVSLRTNIAAIQTQRRLSDNTRALGQSSERLASGLRINHAGDDAAGLAISESLKADTRVFNQGVRNLNDGISLLSIADETIGELSNIVIRIKELAEQASNGIYGPTQRKALDAEAQALSKEFSRVAQSTSFNGKTVLTADFGSVTLQGGYGANGGIQSSLGGAAGTGAFAAPTTYVIGSGRKMATGDLNNDGFLDLISGVAATIQLGRGDGTFGSAVSYAMESSGTDAITVGDLNNDGIVDIVSAGYGASAGRATIRLGNGDGTFGAASSYLMDAAESFGVNLGDLNGDGILDLVTAGGGGSTTTIRLGVGDGTFGARISYGTVGTYALDVGLADFNNDNILDMVSLTNNTGGFVSYRQGVGNGTFGASTVLSMNITGDSGLTVADLNGDGNQDIISSGYGGGAGSVAIRYGQGNGTFSGVVSLAFNAGYGNNLTTGDLNGDGILDIIAAASDGGSTAQITYRLGQGGGTFASAVSVATGAGTSAFGITVGDFNGDGVQDVSTLAFGGGGVSVLTAQTTSGVSALLPFKLTTKAGALQAIAPLDRKLSQLANQRGTIGAFQSRITTAVNTLSTSSENYTTAQSRIADVDVAEEAAKLTRGKILQQSAAAILAQANLQPGIAIDLLPSAGARSK